MGFEGSEIDIGSNRALGSQKKRSKEGTLYSGKICDSGEGIETERVLCSCFSYPHIFPFFKKKEKKVEKR